MTRVKILAAAAVAAVAMVSDVRGADAQPAIDASVIAGVDEDLTAVGRLSVGGFWGFGKFAPEAHIGLDGFLRIDSSQGIAARSFNLIDIGARYGFLSDHFVGPFVSAGGGFGLFTGKPHERKIKGDMELCASANLPSEQPQDECTYRINKHLNARLGFGYGFRSGKKTTVAVRVDVHYWLLSLNDFDPTDTGAPVPSMVSRPQDVWSVLVGLEFMRWR